MSTRDSHPLHYSWICVFVAIGIFIGNIFALIFHSSFFCSPLWFFVAFLLFLCAFLGRHFGRIIFSLFSGLILILCRISPDLSDAQFLQQFIGRELTITGRILEDVDLQIDKINLRLGQLEVLRRPVRGQIFVSLKSLHASLHLRRSEIITITGQARPGFGVFPVSLSRARLLNRTQIVGSDIFLDLRDHFANRITRFVRAPTSSLALGYLLGSKSALDEQLNSELALVGLSHIVVASGANLSILVGFTRRLFGKVSRFASFFVSLSLVLGFVLMVGFSPSLVRAGLVTLCSLLAWYYGKQWQTWRLLLLVSAITLILNPFYLIDLGWLLSFSAFAGILICAPIFTEYFYGDIKINFLRQALIETVSATFLCLPILLYFFGSFSLISVFANLLILPTISIVMAATFATGVFAFCAPLASIFAFLVEKLVSYHLFIIHFFAEQKSFLVTIPKNLPWVFLLYLTICCFLVYFSHQNKKTSQR